MPQHQARGFYAGRGVYIIPTESDQAEIYKAEEWYKILLRNADADKPSVSLTRGVFDSRRIR